VSNLGPFACVTEAQGVPRAKGTRGTAEKGKAMKRQPRTKQAEPLPEILTFGKLREFLKAAPAEIDGAEVWVGFRDGMGFVSEPVVYMYPPQQFFAQGHFVLSAVAYPSPPAVPCSKCKRSER
jgi:hypothetical protein